mmetsp:Transcript_89933/g.259180  ORF Transcript_89933/g.259180 Transcript_89933/m.259180 type:complete len:244 (-) Transcript_89933:717-1448(-)
MLGTVIPGAHLLNNPMPHCLHPTPHSNSNPRIHGVPNPLTALPVKDTGRLLRHRTHMATEPRVDMIMGLLLQLAMILSVHRPLRRIHTALRPSHLRTTPLAHPLHPQIRMVLHPSNHHRMIHSAHKLLNQHRLPIIPMVPHLSNSNKCMDSNLRNSRRLLNKISTSKCMGSLHPSSIRLPLKRNSSNPILSVRPRRDRFQRAKITHLHRPSDLHRQRRNTTPHLSLLRSQNLHQLLPIQLRLQ